MAVHNFILQTNGKKEYREWEYQIEKERREREERLGTDEIQIEFESAADDSGMKEFRDKLAEQMWSDYSTYVHR